MKNLFDKLTRRDLLMHFAGGFFLFVAFDLFYEPWMALMFTTIIATLKEVVWDGLMKKGTPELWDIVYAVIPGLLLIILN